MNTSKTFAPSKTDLVFCADRVEQDKIGNALFVVQDRRKFHLVRIALSSILAMSGHTVTTFAETTEASPEGEIIHCYSFVSDMPYSEFIESKIAFEKQV